MTITPYVLQHTAEEIDNKLDLINENRNILTYPYNYYYVDNNITIDTLPDTLSDVGDGSILTKAIVNNSSLDSPIFLNSCTLAPNKSYIVSITVTDILEDFVTDSNFKLQIKLKDAENNPIMLEDDGTNYTSLNISECALLKAMETETILEVYLVVPSSFTGNLLIKPQVEVQPVNEKGEPLETPTNWVPNMDKIGAYVDRRFNNTNAKFKSLVDKLDVIKDLTAEDFRKIAAILACFDFDFNN